MPAVAARVAGCLAVIALAVGCAEPPRVLLEDAEHESLRVILETYEDCVETAPDRSNAAWHGSWLGNLAVLHLPGRRFGLCHHWQEWVYVWVRPVARREGWDAAGVALNFGRSGEHHAVIVFDPARLTRDELLHAGEDDPAYVLDPWPRARADASTLSTWLNTPDHVDRIAELEDLETLPLLDFLGEDAGDILRQATISARTRRRTTPDVR